jgi:hypothetical protein
VRPILEHGAVCWDPYKEGQINALDRVQKKAAKFANRTNDSVCETSAQRRKTTRICAVYKAHTAERACKDTADRLQGRATWAEMIMIVKLGPGNEEQISGNIAL